MQVFLLLRVKYETFGNSSYCCLVPCCSPGKSCVPSCRVCGSNCVSFACFVFSHVFPCVLPFVFSLVFCFVFCPVFCLVFCLLFCLVFSLCFPLCFPCVSLVFCLMFCLVFSLCFVLCVLPLYLNFNAIRLQYLACKIFPKMKKAWSRNLLKYSSYIKFCLP